MVYYFNNKLNGTSNKWPLIFMLHILKSEGKGVFA